MNSWRARFSGCALILIAMYFHDVATERLPNTPIGMLLYHGSGALVDLFMLFSAPAILSGQLCTDTQKLLLLSIIGNFAGWLLYMAYFSPTFYNCVMLAITYVQLLRLFIPDNYVSSPWVHLVRNRDRGRASNHP